MQKANTKANTHCVGVSRMISKPTGELLAAIAGPGSRESLCASGMRLPTQAAFAGCVGSRSRQQVSAGVQIAHVQRMAMNMGQNTWSSNSLNRCDDGRRIDFGKCRRTVGWRSDSRSSQLIWYVHTGTCAVVTCAAVTRAAATHTARRYTRGGYLIEVSPCVRRWCLVLTW